MIYVEEWEEKACHISEVQVGEIFTDYSRKKPTGVYMRISDKKPSDSVDYNSFENTLRVRALDILQMENEKFRDMDPVIRFSTEVFVYKAKLTPEGEAYAAGIVASEG